MIVFWIWLAGFVITVLTLGVLYKKDKIPWHPAMDGNPPHIVAGILWPIFVPIVTVVYLFILLYKGINYVTDYISTIKIEKKE